MPGVHAQFLCKFPVVFRDKCFVRMGNALFPTKEHQVFQVSFYNRHPQSQHQGPGRTRERSNTTRRRGDSDDVERESEKIRLESRRRRATSLGDAGEE